MAWIAERRRQSRFEAVVLPHLDAGFALARWLTRNVADAADVVQEACLRAFRYFDSYREGDAKSWLLKIVRRTTYDWLDRNRPAELVPLERRHFGPAIGTVLQMGAQRHPLGLGELAIEIGVEPGAHLIAFHYPHPFPSQARRSAARARCNRDITVPIGTPVTSAIWR